MEFMRVASENGEGWKRVRVLDARSGFRLLKSRRSALIQAAETRVAAHLRRVASEFILLYLTLVAIFDNRHGLLKKFDVGARRKPCQPQSHI
jgi:hypothetical protein